VVLVSDGTKLNLATYQPVTYKNASMSLLAALTTILARLEKGEFANEQAIKQGVVLRMILVFCRVKLHVRAA